MTVSDFFGLSGHLLLVIGTVLVVCRSHYYPLSARILLLITAVVIGLWPMQDLTIVEYVRGWAADISITSMVVLVLSIASRVSSKSYYTPGSFAILMYICLGFGLCLYPMTLGLTYMDPYTLGYASWWLWAILFTVTLLAWCFRVYLVVACVILSVLGYTLSISDSRNLWDYLIDPLIVFYSIFWLLGVFIKYLFSSNRLEKKHLSSASDAIAS